MRDFDIIYRKYAPTIRKYVISLGADEILSEDITADVFVKAIKNIDSFDGSCKMLTWLCAIAKNTYINSAKRKDNNNTALDATLDYCVADKFSPENIAEQKERKLVLHRAIMKLEYPYRDVVYQRSFAELSFREIGDIMGKSENWARVTFYRGKNILKGLLDNEI